MQFQENKAQEEAVHTITGPVLIIACPGSGKTTVLMRRINYLIRTGIDPARILTVTFTKAAADGMSKKYASMYGTASGSVFMTIHALCFNILIKEGIYKRESLFTEQEKNDFFISRLKWVQNIGDVWETARAVITEVSACKNNYIKPEDSMPTSCDKDTFVHVFKDYEKYLRENGRIDYDDMLIETKNLFDRDASVLARWQKYFDYIQCDEYQDTNLLQKDILYMLSARTRNFCVVGDDDQSIYRFRGARPEIMLSFRDDFPDAKVINMSTNYRSAKNIVIQADALIRENTARYEKDFLSFRGLSGAMGSVKICPKSNRKDEMKDIINDIEEQHMQGMPYSSIAILFRTNVQSELPMQMLSEKKIPFFSTETVKCLYDHFIFQDMMCYARLSMGKGTSADLSRILNRPNRYFRDAAFRNAEYTKESLLNALSSYLAGQEAWKYDAARKDVVRWMKCLGPGKITSDTSPSVLYKALFGTEGIRYDKFLKDYAKFRNLDYSELREVVDQIREDSHKHRAIGEWAAYAERYKKMIREKSTSKNEQGVVISTMHKSKGLEWDRVYILDADEGRCPHKQSLGSSEALEEERRLFYVAMTRAKDDLLIYYATANPSRYIRPSLKQQFSPGPVRSKPYASVLPDSKAEKKPKGKVQKKLAGSPVRHISYGDGTVVKYQGDRIFIKFPDKERAFKFPGGFESGFLEWK